VLCNLQSLEQGETYAKQKNLSDAPFAATGRPGTEYGLMYIPHKTLISKDGKVVKNFDMQLPADLDALLA